MTIDSPAFRPAIRVLAKRVAAGKRANVTTRLNLSSVQSSGLAVPGSLEVAESAGRMWASLELQVVNGRGPVTPRLQFVFTARPVEYARVILRDVTLRGRTSTGADRRAPSGATRNYPRQRPGRLRASHVARALQWVTDSLVASSTSIQLDATLQGVAAFAMDLDAPTTYQRQRLINDPEPGQWKDFLVSSSYARPLLLPRADWYAQVLAPTRNEQYRYLGVSYPGVMIRCPEMGKQLVAP